MSCSHRPIIVVTGANAGLGFGICHRLLFQLCQAQPSDALPSQDGQKFHSDTRTEDILQLPCEGLTLILACRRVERAVNAKKRLLTLLDAHIAKLKKASSYDGHAEKFRQNLQIQVHSVDLSIISSVFDFCKELTENYPYISHLIFNAGVASFTRIAWLTCFKQLARNPLAAITAPEYYLQNSGEKSIDALGWVWQSNLFSHYVIARLLQPLLTTPYYPHDSRVIWVSSIEASPKFYNSEDWQLIETESSYQSVKYQMDILASRLDQLSLKSVPESSKRIRHLIAEPGVCHTGIATQLIGPVLDFVKVLAFYVGRFLGSTHHPITSYKGAISFVHLSLVSLQFLTFSTFTPLKYSSQTDRWAKERVGVFPVKDWKTHEIEAQQLLDKCENLLQSFITERSMSANPEYETASEKM